MRTMYTNNNSYFSPVACLTTACGGLETVKSNFFLLQELVLAKRLPSICLIAGIIHAKLLNCVSDDLSVPKLYASLHNFALHSSNV